MLWKKTHTIFSDLFKYYAISILESGWQILYEQVYISPSHSGERPPVHHVQGTRANVPDSSLQSGKKVLTEQRWLNSDWQIRNIRASLTQTKKETRCTAAPLFSRSVPRWFETVHSKHKKTDICWRGATSVRVYVCPEWMKCQTYHAVWWPCSQLAWPCAL